MNALSTKSRADPVSVWLPFVAVVAFIIFTPPRPLSAHLLIEGTSLDVVIHRDRIAVRADVTADEIRTVQSLNAKIQDIAGYGQYLVSHLHMAADGITLAGSLLRVTEPAAPGERAVYEMEYRSGARNIWPEDAVTGRVLIAQNILSEVVMRGAPKIPVIYVVRIGYEGQSAQEGLPLSRRTMVSFAWNRPSPAAKHVSEGTGGAAGSAFWAYVQHGVMHILTGYDHLLFISALVLAAVSFWDMIKVVTAFTIAHTITLCVSALNLFRLPPEIVEPAIAVSIVFIALQNVFWPDHSHGRLRLAAAFFFGLFHGLGFAGGLLEAMQGMSGKAALLAILAFSIGVELGHQVVVIPLFGALRFGRWWKNRRPQFLWRSEWVVRCVSGVIAGAGMFFLVSALRLANR